MAELQKNLDEIDNRKNQLLNGVVEHNFELPGLGYYHAEAQDFFPYRYAEEKDGKWFANGEWLTQEPARCSLTTSRPSETALRKIELFLEREQQLVSQEGEGSASSTTHHHHGGMGMGNMLMMYWLLSSNRGGYSPGAGFQNAQANHQNWQQSVNQQRQLVNSHASAHPGYNRLVQQSKATGAPVTQGSSVRGGFGTSKRSSTSSSWGG